MTDRVDHPHIVTIDSLDWTGTNDGGGWKRLGREAGGTRLGCTLEVIHPGHSPAEYHYHTANEEAMYVLAGHGTMRSPAGTTPIESGDYVAFPVGESGAHAVENTSDEILECLFISTMQEPDIVVYPDAEELHVFAGAALGRPKHEFTLDAVLPFDTDSLNDADSTT